MFPYYSKNILSVTVRYISDLSYLILKYGHWHFWNNTDFLVWWAYKHLSFGANSWPNLEILKTQIFLKYFDNIQPKSSLELFIWAAAYIFEKNT